MAGTLPPGMRQLVLLALVLQAAAAPALPLWEITGTRNRIVLLGSIHFLRAADYPLAPAIASAFGDPNSTPHLPAVAEPTD